MYGSDGWKLSASISFMRKALNDASENEKVSVKTANESEKLCRLSFSMKVSQY